MPKKTKQNQPDEEEQSSATECETDKEGNWSRDQREKSYYYDDSYGYEIYNPDEDEDNDDEE
ncbi:MAG: hypothetical protein LH614_09055 [Pyrinomonadaceae bacterium]|nr:hypothetical protein [Pyrinomonadaceae bacterium]